MVCSFKGHIFYGDQAEFVTYILIMEIFDGLRSSES